MVGEVTTATTQKAQLQPPFGPSEDLLCHPRITTIHLSYSFLSLELPLPLVRYYWSIECTGYLYLSVCLSICLSVYLPICLSVRLSVYLSNLISSHLISSHLSIYLSNLT